MEGACSSCLTCARPSSTHAWRRTLRCRIALAAVSGLVLCSSLSSKLSTCSLHRPRLREQVDFDGCETVPSVNFDGDQYNVLQVHVHSLSEHTVRSRTSDTPLHGAPHRMRKPHMYRIYVSRLSISCQS